MNSSATSWPVIATSTTSNWRVAFLGVCIGVVRYTGALLPALFRERGGAVKMHSGLVLSLEFGLMVDMFYRYSFTCN